jgi:hypothetical protein
MEGDPNRFEIGSNGAGAPRLGNPDGKVDHCQEQNRQRRSRGKTKAANGGAKPTADGQKDGCGAKHRSHTKNEESLPDGLTA